MARRTKTVATVNVARANAGRSVLTWNAKIKRAVAARGSYSLVVTAVTTAADKASAKASLRIT